MEADRPQPIDQRNKASVRPQSTTRVTRVVERLIDTMAEPPPPGPLRLRDLVVLLVSVLVLLGFMIGILDTEALAAQVPALLFFFILIVLLLLPIVSSRGRRKLAEWASAGRRYIVIFAVLLLATTFFAVLTGVLYQQGVLRLEGPNLSSDTIGSEAMGFYLWHLSEEIPLLNITETLRWDAPLEHRDVWGGLLVLAYKVLVIIPIVAALTIRRAGKDRGVTP